MAVFLKSHGQNHKMFYDNFHMHRQARNQLGMPRGTKRFFSGAQNFYTMSNRFELCPKHFSRGSENFSRGLRPPWLRACSQVSQIVRKAVYFLSKNSGFAKEASFQNLLKKRTSFLNRQAGWQRQFSPSVLTGLSAQWKCCISSCNPKAQKQNLYKTIRYYLICSNKKCITNFVVHFRLMFPFLSLQTLRIFVGNCTGYGDI